MKKVCFFVSSFVALASFSNAQSVSIMIGGTNYPVAFTDTSFSAANKQVIASDMAIVLSYATSFDALKGDAVDGQTGVFALRTPPLPRLPFNGQPDIQILQNGTAESIRIGKAVSDAYIQAIAMRDANPRAFQKAYEFLALLKDPDLLNKPVATLQGLCHTKPICPVVSPPDNAIIAFAADTQNFIYPGISLLDFNKVNIPQAGNEPLLSFNLLFVSKTNPSECMRFHVVYYENQWGLGWIPF